MRLQYEKCMSRRAFTGALQKIQEQYMIIEKIEKLKRKYSADVRTVNCISAFFNKSELSNKTSNFITEASFLKTDSIILGAGPITAHEVDEYITKKSLDMLVEQYKQIINDICK